jgi:lipid-A-disaccharide synthase
VPPEPAPILFTAFEPSGDAHAAPVIARLLRRRPTLRVYAWGGPKMEAAGATVVEQTCDDGSMALAATRSPAPIIDAWRRIRRIARWSREHRPAIHVPVDSPAANFPICRHLKKQGARIVHLVAPQIWAWARWRIGKLRRRTDLVLCLLPFEEQWFNDRRVPARFIGHPTLNRAVDEDAERRSAELPEGDPRIAIFPGSRSHEVQANLGALVEVFGRLRERHPQAAGLIVASNEQMREHITTVTGRADGTLPKGLTVVVGGVDAAVAWCDLALPVSGTVTLDITRQRKPMVAVYALPLISRIGARLIVRIPDILLPNIIAGRRIVPEFMPFDGDTRPVVREAERLLNGSDAAAAQRAALEEVCAMFADHDPAEEAAELIGEVMDGKGSGVRGQGSGEGAAAPLHT